MNDERIATAEEIRRVKRTECKTQGHDFSLISEMQREGPVSVVCDRWGTGRSLRRRIDARREDTGRPGEAFHPLGGTDRESVRRCPTRRSSRSQRTSDRIGTKPQKKHHESMIPPGVSLRQRDPSKPPPKERSLFDFYVWKFTHTDPNDRAELFNLWLLAERDYHARVLHIPRRVAIRSGEDAKGAVSGVEAENEAAKRVVEIYEGMSAEEAAVFEYTTVEVIRKARKMHRRNIDDGRPRPPFLEWDEDERRRQISLLRGRERDQGREIGAKSLGKHFGVDAKTIRKYTQAALPAAA